MDITQIPPMENRYYWLVIAWEYLSGWAETSPPKWCTSVKIANIIDKEVIGQVRTTKCQVVDGRAQNKK